MPRRGGGAAFNDGRELCLVWVRRRDDGSLYAPRPMVQLVDFAQPVQFAAAYRGLVLFPLGCICPVVLPSSEYALTKVAADDPTWPVPRLPSTGVVQTEYGRDPDKTSRGSDIGAMPAAHLRAIVWSKPKLREQSPQAPVHIVAMLTAAEFRAPQAAGPSMADLLFNGCGVRAPTVEVTDGDQSQLGFTVTCATFAMALAIFHAHGVVAEVGVTKNVADEDFDKIVTEYCDVMIADNLKRNYNSWKQDMDVDPRKGEPRRDKLNWPMDFLPAPIQQWIRAHNDFPAYTMESIAFLVGEACDPEEKMRLNLMPQPMLAYIHNERILAGVRDADERVAAMQKMQEEIATYVKTLRSFNPSPLGAVGADDAPPEGDMRLRAVMGCPKTRALLEREVELKREKLEILAQVHDAEEKNFKGRKIQKPPDVQHLTKPQERQLVACLYARAVYHGTNPNLLQVAQTFAWVYFLHGKIGRFIGPYKMH